MFEIIVGLVAGTVIFFGATFLLAKREILIHEKIVAEEEESINEEDPVLPLEKKLRNTIYECQQNILACKKQITKICKDQLDLLKDVGKVSHIPVKDKPLYFEYYNPVSQKRHFYYERDLSKKIAPEILENTQMLALKYSKQIDLLSTQQELFEKLIHSHKENLDRLNGIKKHSSQSEKLKIHEEKISEMTQNTSLEEKAIYNELLIGGINDELEHQEECMRQYIALNEKYDNPFDEKIEEKYKIQIKEIIKQLEDEDVDK